MNPAAVAASSQRRRVNCLEASCSRFTRKGWYRYEVMRVTCTFPKDEELVGHLASEL